eukprot:g15824.t1
MLTLVQFITLDSIYQTLSCQDDRKWIYRPLVVEKPELVFYFLGLLLILPITLLNLVTAVLVENGITQAQKEAEFEMKARSAEMRSAVMQLLDTSVSEKTEDLCDLFDLLDVDHTGEISQEEFVDGVLQMVVRDVPAETMRSLAAIDTVVGYIQLHLLLAWTSMFAFSFGGVKMIVLSTFLYGFALGPLFPGALLVAEEKLAPEPLDGRAAGFTVACAALGETWMQRICCPGTWQHLKLQLMWLKEVASDALRKCCCPC